MKTKKWGESFYSPKGKGTKQGNLIKEYYAANHSEKVEDDDVKDDVIVSTLNAVGGSLLEYNSSSN